MFCEMVETDFVEFVKRVIRERGWTQAELAARMGMTDGSVSRVLKRERLPGVDFLHGFAQATGYKDVEVFIRAGWLSGESGDSDSDLDALSLFSSLSPDEQQMILNMMRGLLVLKARHG